MFSIIYTFHLIFLVLKIGSLSINGVHGMQNISNFAPPVSSGYTISPNNSRIILTDSGDLIIDPLSPQDTGTYTFTSTDLEGATLSITVEVYGRLLHQ